MIVSKSTFAII